MTELRRRMDEDMLVRGLADRTRETYIAAVARLASFYRRSPERISEREIQAYVVHMMREEKLSTSTCLIAVYAFKFFYHHTLGRSRSDFELPCPRQPQKLPEILSRQEIERLFDAAANPKHRTLLMTTYAAGLRVSEAVGLRVINIDSQRMTLRIEQGKGGKDRCTPLSPRLLEQLRSYWKQYHPDVFLFPTRGGDAPMDVSTAQKLYYAAKRRAGIAKRGGIHALRHAFATHLLEAGTDVSVIQRLMGHRSISTTVRYVRVAQKTLMGIASPLDILPPPSPKVTP
jgi:site-specific recombinase XerD